MNAFQILDGDNKAISINLLDKEAAEFWGKEVHPKQYANPAKPREANENEIDFLRRSMLGNWFDIIGYQIANPLVEWTSGWNNVKCTLMSIALVDLYKHFEDMDKTLVHIHAAWEYNKPYFELIDHWESKGYQPKQIKE